MAMKLQTDGLLLVVSGPSGVGKGTVCRELVKHIKLFYSVSATTRNRRVGEEEGVHYYYKTQDEFMSMIRNKKLLEWAEFCGNFYGTPKIEVFERIQRGQDVLLEIDVKGAMQVKREYPEGIFVFLAPPKVSDLEKRIRGRNTETEEVIQKRLLKARDEIALVNEYNYIVVNDDIETAIESIRSILDAEKHRIERNQKFIQEVLC